MKVEKKIISNLTKCYSIAPLHYHEQDYILVAAEKQDPCLLFDCEGNQVDKVWDGPGGTMSMVQVAIFGAVICVMAFTLPRIYPAWIYPCDDHTYPGYYSLRF